MPSVTFNGNTYSCVTAYKGPDYVHLVDGDGTLVVAFDGVTDFSGFSITDGNWSTTPDKNCCLAVFGENGAILRGKTVDSAIVGTYTHSEGGLTGSGENGRFKATTSGTISSIDVNGVTYSVKCGEDTSMDLVADCWYTFILDGSTVNFNSGGGVGFKESTDYPGCYFHVVDGVTEWLNPPMVPGTEYRTIERYNKKVVYTKAVNFGALPDATEKTVSSGLKSSYTVVDFKFLQYNSDSVSFISDYTEGLSVWLGESKAKIVCTTPNDMSSTSGLAFMKYTK